MDTDALLIQRMKQGSEDAMEIFVRRYYPVILRHLRYRLAGKEDAEDLTQETFVRFFSALPNYRHQGKALNFLYTISGNLCADYYRAAKSLPLSLSEEEADSPDAAFPADQIHAGIDVRQALSRLPEELREVILLYYYEDLKQKDIAKILQIGLPLVKYRLRQAKERLLADLDDSEGSSRKKKRRIPWTD